MTQRTFIRPENPLPVGCVVPWTGTIQNIPYGWVLCDGNNGTQDMQDRFMQQKIGSVGTVVGNNTITLSTTNLPAHTHGGDVDPDGSHYHQLAYDDSTARDPFGSEYGSANQRTAYTNYTGDHHHNINSGYSGSSAQIDNRPYTFRVHFIEKIL